MYISHISTQQINNAIFDIEYAWLAWPLGRSVRWYERIPDTRAKSTVTTEQYLSITEARVIHSELELGERRARTCKKKLYKKLHNEVAYAYFWRFWKFYTFGRRLEFPGPLPVFNSSTFKGNYSWFIVQISFLYFHEKLYWFFFYFHRAMFSDDSYTLMELTCLYELLIMSINHYLC